MSMNEFLAQYYGTGSNAEVESEKLASAEEAQIELFAKLAADNGIDLEKLSEEQVEALYAETFKEAAEKEEKDDKKAPPFEKKDDGDKDDKEEKKAQAEAEFAEKKASQEKIAEADFLGRVMAHSYVNEMRKIAESAEGSDKEAGVKETAGKAWESMKGHAGSAASKVKETAGKAYEGGKSVAKGEKARAAFKALRAGADEAKGETKGPHMKHHGKELAKGVAATGGMYGGAAAAVGAGGYAAHKKLKKEGSALDELAVGRAVEIVDGFNKQAGEEVFDLEEAAGRIDAVHMLGLGESTKVAAAADAEQGVEVRALEFLEAAGYPVTWAE